MWLSQAEDRAHRVGQMGTVLVRYLTSPDTCDDIMWPLLNKKLQVVGQVIDGAGVGKGEYCDSVPSSSLHRKGALLEPVLMSREALVNPELLFKSPCLHMLCLVSYCEPVHMQQEHLEVSKQFLMTFHIFLCYAAWSVNTASNVSYWGHQTL